MEDVRTRCPICENEHVLKLTPNQYERYLNYKNGHGHIQDLLPEISADDRERLITGICPVCWHQIMEDNENE